MNLKKALLTSAALSGLMIAGCASSGSHHDSGGGLHAAVEGQCHGVNACKGKGDCSGKGYKCAGENACEGKGWLKMSKAQCDSIKKSTWTPIPKDIQHKG